MNELTLARMMTFILGAIGILFAYYMATLSVNSIWDEFNKVLGIILGSMGGVFLLGLLVRRANSFGAMVGIACSIIAQLYVSLFTPMPFMLYRSEEHTSELQSLMRISYAVFCLNKKQPKEL